jgi:hypothetical protein
MHAHLCCTRFLRSKNLQVSAANLILSLGAIGIRQRFQKGQYHWQRIHSYQTFGAETLFQHHRSETGRMERKMKTLTVLALLSIVVLTTTATTQMANAVVYCQYIDYPAGCVAQPGVVLRPRVVAPVRNQAIRNNTGGAVNKGGPVNRAGRR